jgi:hypothetical protein
VSNPPATKSENLNKAYNPETVAMRSGCAERGCYGDNFTMPEYWSQEDGNG